ncbi:hypothetical protein RIF23_18630 [Lipingzhangella sp. LS1_29]|uniref:Integral membrane protein n=1 Tax=Lipingzhangella rawalii TaxID=2055835 RepID=A0ABU2HAG0_9ACTN|nr:hypothetical protein [Lipingzhangella rawalii]MDS1272309.1 hypothetical protein [Lipingzhangella rawalii]
MTRQHSPDQWRTYPTPPLVPPPEAHASARRRRIQQFAPLLAGLGATTVVAVTITTVFFGLLGVLFSVLSGIDTGRVAYDWALFYGAVMVTIVAVTMSLYAYALRYLGARRPWTIAALVTCWGGLLVLPTYFTVNLLDLFIGYVLVVSAVSGIPAYFLLKLRVARRSA